MKFTPFLILLVLILGQDIIAQSHHADHDHHHHPKNEIGVGNYLSYLAGEREIAYGLHIHYLRFIKESRFGAGIGFEQIFDEHKHRALTIIGAYKTKTPLVLSLAPGILFPTEENPGIRFNLHTEIVYEFEISRFHIGPALEFSTTFDEYHIGIGLHVAYTF